VQPSAAEVASGDAALVIIDVQNDFGHPRGALGALGADTSMCTAMLPRLISLIGEARSAGVEVVFVRSRARAYVSDAWRGKVAPTICATDWGREYMEGVVPLEGEAEVTKNRYGAFTNTDLDTVLRSKGVKTLLLVGTATNVCVETTAREAICRDYAPVVVLDCCAATSQEEHDAAALNIERYFGWTLSSKDLTALWAS
jgi:ureidoacrylate peracid hydrolase